MNDFTKEELQIMLLDMECYINRTTILAESPSHKSLRDKLQSMIDNYCDHECLVTDNESGHGHNWTNICRKCGVKFR